MGAALLWDGNVGLHLLSVAGGRGRQFRFQNFQCVRAVGAMSLERRS